MREKLIGKQFSFISYFIRRKYTEIGQTAFADGFPFLIVSEAAVEELVKNAQIPPHDSSITPLSALNFRPNIVVGQCQPFAEDSWKEITVADPERSSRKATFSLVKPCSRCKMPNVNPCTGSFFTKNDRAENLYVSAALQTYRTGEQLKFSPKNSEGKENNPWKKQVFFGQNAQHHEIGGFIRVGDVIRVHQYR